MFVVQMIGRHAVSSFTSAKRKATESHTSMKFQGRQEVCFLVVVNLSSAQQRPVCSPARDWSRGQLQSGEGVHPTIVSFSTTGWALQPDDGWGPAAASRRVCALGRFVLQALSPNYQVVAIKTVRYHEQRDFDLYMKEVECLHRLLCLCVLLGK